jgi:hypothetical protein
MAFLVFGLICTLRLRTRHCAAAFHLFGCYVIQLRGEFQLWISGLFQDCTHTRNRFSDEAAIAERLTNPCKPEAENKTVNSDHVAFLTWSIA